MQVQPVIRPDQQDQIKYRNFAVPDFVLKTGVALPANINPMEVRGKVFAIAFFYEESAEPDLLPGRSSRR